MPLLLSTHLIALLCNTIMLPIQKMMDPYGATTDDSKGPRRKEKEYVELFK